MTQAVCMWLLQNIGDTGGQERQKEREKVVADMQSDRHRKRNKTEIREALDRGTMWQRARAPRPFRSLSMPLHQRNKLSSFTSIYVSRAQRSAMGFTLGYLEVAHRSSVNKERGPKHKSRGAALIDYNSTGCFV